MESNDQLIGVADCGFFGNVCNEAFYNKFKKYSKTLHKGIDATAATGESFVLRDCVDINILDTHKEEDSEEVIIIPITIRVYLVAGCPYSLIIGRRLMKKLKYKIYKETYLDKISKDKYIKHE